MHLNRPNSSDAPAIFSGFQLPKIITASARKPKPATSPLELQLAVVSAYTKPPMPASAPEMVVPAYRILYTLMPSESAAWGFSPQERSRIPNLVLYSRMDSTTKMIRQI